MTAEASIEAPPADESAALANLRTEERRNAVGANGVRRGLYFALGLVIVAVGGWLFGSGLFGEATRATALAAPSFCVVARTDLPVLIRETGVLESQQEQLIRCPVDDVSGDGIVGTTILWIVPNGSQVEKGDLLVNFDHSHHLERRARQVLAVEQARADKIKAQVTYETAQRDLQDTVDAETRLKWAEIDLAIHKDERGPLSMEVQSFRKRA